MKNLFTLILIIFFIPFTVQAQTFKIGPNIGYALGDAGDAHNIVIGADAYYYFTNIDSFFGIGLTAGFRAFTGEEDINDVGFEIPNQSYLPAGLAARIKILDFLAAGADAGYAFGLADLDGGFYFRPLVSIDIADAIEIFACYEYISTGTDSPLDDVPDNFKFDIDYTSAGIGLLFTF